MRLWSIHPGYLDGKGLVALWRESLLAKRVLEGKTRGYMNHPQLDRFKNSRHPLAAINAYLENIADEADRRGYGFDRRKISPFRETERISVSSGQLDYEMSHLKNKLKARDGSLYKKIINESTVRPHPLFRKTEGGIEEWERINRK